jgi:hypothetical protein
MGKAVSQINILCVELHVAFTNDENMMENMKLAMTCKGKAEICVENVLTREKL